MKDSKFKIAGPYIYFNFFIFNFELLLFDLSLFIY